MDKSLPMVFCFGSNEAGVHGAGAALHANIEHGAKHGCGFGYCAKVKYPNVHGQNPSRRGAVLEAHSFAIPTKDYEIKSLPLDQIQAYVNAFLAFAAARQDLQFKVTQIGCGLAGFTAEQIAPMFLGGQPNVHYDMAWVSYLSVKSRFWGTA